ncbi:hypothetical protein HYH02_008638 [Chlamydomonas schloesseri]|uniref:Uncharacterized protein n=1 Tax=Chlamydomonas schloesseri TaxID=2026947 RepID=A0A835WDF8_9CHLO|nr:hypothetical protein HYH02_008638 [Chlamydomonas schloesseri]|eukprot:KAG2445170.1 hypothetical protein HYH02_008638 [Chlamydomonas schloesseri]
MRGKRPHVVQETQHNFTRFRTNWGFNKLVLRTALLDPAEGWLDAEGSLVLRVDVRQVVPHWDEYAGVERQHYDTVRSSAALAAALAARGVSDLALSLAFTEDGRSRVDYSLHGRVYDTAAELRAALAASSESLRDFFASSAAAATLGDLVGPAAVDGGGAAAPGVAGQGAVAGGTAAMAPNVGDAAAAPPAPRGAAGGVAATALPSRYSSLTALGINIDVAPASGIAGAFSGRVGGGAGSLGAGNNGGAGGASSGIVAELAARLSLLGGYVTTPMAVGGVAYLAVAVAFQVRSWGRSIAALLSRGGKHKDKHGHAKPGAKGGKQLKGKSRSNSSGRHHDSPVPGSSSGGGGGAGVCGSSGGGISGGGTAGLHGPHGHAHAHTAHAPTGSPNALSPSNSQSRRTAAATAAAAAAAVAAAAPAAQTAVVAAAAATAATPDATGAASVPVAVDRAVKSCGGAGLRLSGKTSTPGDTLAAGARNASSSTAQPPASPAATAVAVAPATGGRRARSGGGAPAVSEAGVASAPSTSVGLSNGATPSTASASTATLVQEPTQAPVPSLLFPSAQPPPLPPLTGSGGAGHSAPLDTPAVWLLPLTHAATNATAVTSASAGDACSAALGGSAWDWRHPSDQRAFLGPPSLLGLGLGPRQDGGGLLAAVQPSSAPQPFLERRLRQQLSGGGAGAAGRLRAGAGPGMDGADGGVAAGAGASFFSPPTTTGLLSRSLEGCAAAFGLGREAGPYSLMAGGLYPADDSSRGASGNVTALGDEEEDDDEADGSIPAWVANSLLDAAAREEEEQQERLARSGSSSTRCASAGGVAATAAAALAAAPAPAEPAGPGSAPMQGRSRVEAGSGGGAGQKRGARAHRRGKAGGRGEAVTAAPTAVAAAAHGPGNAAANAQERTVEAAAVQEPAAARSVTPSPVATPEVPQSCGSADPGAVATAAAAAAGGTGAVSTGQPTSMAFPAPDSMPATSIVGIAGWVRAMAPVMLRAWQTGGWRGIIRSAAALYRGSVAGQDVAAGAAAADTAAGPGGLLAAESVFDGLQRELAKRLAVVLVATARGMLALAASLVEDDGTAGDAAAGDGAAGAAASATGAAAPVQPAESTDGDAGTPAAPAICKPQSNAVNCSGGGGGGGSSSDLCEQDQIVDPPPHLAARRGGGRSVAPGPVSLPATAHATANGSGGGAGPSAPASGPLTAAPGSLAAAPWDAWGSGAVSITSVSCASASASVSAGLPSRTAAPVTATVTAPAATVTVSAGGALGTGALWSGRSWSQPQQQVQSGSAGRLAGAAGGVGGMGEAGGGTGGGSGSRAAGLLAMGVQLGLVARPLREEPCCQLCLRHAPDCGLVHADSICVAACFGCAQQLASAPASAPVSCPFCSKAIVSVLAVQTVEP